MAQRPASLVMRRLIAAGLCEQIVVIGWSFLTVPLSPHSKSYPSDIPHHPIQHHRVHRSVSASQPTVVALGGSGFTMPIRCTGTRRRRP